MFLDIEGFLYFYPYDGTRIAKKKAPSEGKGNIQMTQQPLFICQVYKNNFMVYLWIPFYARPHLSQAIYGSDPVATFQGIINILA